MSSAGVMSSRDQGTTRYATHTQLKQHVLCSKHCLTTHSQEWACKKKDDVSAAARFVPFTIHN